jgi:4-hydroxymandelate oxidase
MPDAPAKAAAPVSLFDYERLAREKLPGMVYDYYAGAAMDEITLRENRAAYERRALHYHVLAGVGAAEPGTTVVGHAVSMPVLVAPTAFHRMAHPEGEVAAVRAAGKAGTVFVLSTLSNTGMEEVTAAANGPVWFQLYIYKDRAVTRDLIKRAESAGVQAIVLTVDAPVWGTREADVRNRFHLPDGLFVENLSPAGKQAFPRSAGSGLAAYVAQMFDGGIGWRDLDWLCAQTRLPVVVKGVCRADDARRCADHGAKALVVSNHGGRQLDTSPATLDALPAVAEAVQGKLEVYVDGGVRRGTDVVKALALGARAVLVGRPVLWGLAAGGEAGVSDVLAILKREVTDALALCGYAAPDRVRRDVLGAS